MDTYTYTHPAPSTGTAELTPVYWAQHAGTGDQFVIYAPTDDAPKGIYTVAHFTGTQTLIALPTVTQVHPDDLAAYAAAAVRVLCDRHAGRGIHVSNRAAWPLNATLPS